MRYRFVICFALIAAMISLPARAQFQTPKNTAGKKSQHHTAVTLVADVNHIQPGVPFSVGVLMQMDKGWHTYWKNAGEAGLATEITWDLPKGFRAGDIQWPLPHKYNESGDVLTYGYETENMLHVQITPPKNLAASSVTLKAVANWLECERVCVPGDASVQLTLPVSAEPAGRDNELLFAKYRARIPQLLQPNAGLRPRRGVENAGVEVLFTPKNGLVEIELRGRSLVRGRNNLPDFFPEPVDGVTLGRTQVSASASTAVLRTAVLRIPLTADGKLQDARTLRGVLLYRLEGEEEKFATLEIPLPKEFVATIPIEGSAEASPAQTGNLLDQTFTTIESEQSRQSLTMYLLFAIIGGLLLNIMPCVLPVIALKIFGLVKMGGSDPREVKKSGWLFSLGILASFLALAMLVILLKSAGESVGWGFQFQEPIFVIAMSTLVFAFGLSLFGVFEISVPRLLLLKAGQVSSPGQTKSALAPFAEGVFATILATPCTAPFLGSAMGFAFSQPSSIILLLFAAVAFGMSLPYLILTSKPAWTRFLPKPGEWMVTAKQFMGFLMMATVVWLLYILGKQLGMEAVVWTVAFLLFVGVACWMIGTFATLTATRMKYFATWGIALALVVAGYNFFVGDVLKARDVLSGSITDTASAATTEANGIEWQPFTIEKLESHLKENKPVFIDFTAEWCLTCKVNEKTVLADKDVVNALKHGNIVTMKADWTNRNETITKLLQKFGRSGVPLYVIFPAGKPTEPIVLPEVITPGIVIEAVKKAMSAS